MKKRNPDRTLSHVTIRWVALLLAVLVASVGAWEFAERTQAATPASGDLNATLADSETWIGDKAGTPAAANGEPTCSTGDATATNCDVYTLIANPGSWVGKRILVKFTWQFPSTDYDMVVRRETNGIPGMQGDGLTGVSPTPDAVVATSGAGATVEESVVLGPSDAGETFYVRAIYFAGGGPGLQYAGSAVVEANVATPPGASSCALPTFDNYQPPVGFPRRDDSGEPSIGANWNSGNVMSMSRLRANRTTFNDSTSPAHPTTGTTWFSQSSPALVTGFDPILFTDSVTGRTIAGELQVVGGATNGIISDDDLTTVVATFQTGGSQGVDHQTIGGGPPNPSIAGRQPTGSYPHLFYYASQAVAAATVATSFDGGLTYQAAVPAYNLSQCGGLHGHIKVAPDGTVYLPNKGCNGLSGFAVSTDNGLTWAVRTVPGSTAGNTDPSLGIGAGGRVYYAYAGGDNHPYVAVSNDRGLTWSNHFDLSTLVSPNITASVFPHAVAGDNNRAAVFFLATASTNSGDPVGDDATSAFAGTWYPYIGTTCDGGVTWSVVRADNDPLLAPGTKNPVQQGVVCTNGTTCPAGPPDTRNLLDFNEMTVDSRGRIHAVYADGCNPPNGCMTLADNAANTTKANNEGNARLTIIRQRGGMRLFSAFDPGGPIPPPLPPPVWIEETKGGYGLKWATPDDGNSPLRSYRIYRGWGGGREQLIATVRATQHTFFDRRTFKNAPAGLYYKVTAVNAYGESPRNVKFFPQ